MDFVIIKMLYLNPKRLQEIQEAKQNKIRQVRADKQLIREEKARRTAAENDKRALLTHKIETLEKSIHSLQKPKQVPSVNKEKNSEKYTNNKSDSKIHSISHLKSNSNQNVTAKVQSDSKEFTLNEEKTEIKNENNQPVETKDQRSKSLDKESYNKYGKETEMSKESSTYENSVYKYKNTIKTLKNRPNHSFDTGNTKKRRKKAKTPDLYKSNPLLIKPGVIIKQNEMFVHIVGEHPSRSRSNNRVNPISTCSKHHQADINQVSNPYTPYRHMFRDIPHDKHVAVYSDRINRMLNYYKNRVKVDFQPVSSINKSIEREWRNEQAKLMKLKDIKRVSISEL